MSHECFPWLIQACTCSIVFQRPVSRNNLICIKAKKITKQNKTKNKKNKNKEKTPKNQVQTLSLLKCILPP